MRLLKFVKGQFLSGDNEVPAGREFIAHANQLAHGYTKFVGGKVAEQRMGLVADPTFVLPERADLGDTDQSTWETDHNSKPRDPWTRQYYLPLEDNETGGLIRSSPAPRAATPQSESCSLSTCAMHI